MSNVIANTSTNFITIFKSPHFIVPLIVALALVVLGNFFAKSVETKMGRFFFKLGDSKFDLWSLSHVLLYMYFGYYFPGYFVEFLIIGIVWEIIECVACPATKKVFGCNNNNNNLVCNFIKQIDRCDYWYGKWEDVPVNIIGFVIGARLSTRKNK